MASVDESISRFFSEAGACTTQAQCDDWTSNNIGGPIKPVPSQGAYSYTVTAANGTLIVQFRAPTSPLDTQTLQMVKNAHPDFVASCTLHGTIGSSPGLLVYSMTKLPGNSYFSISLELSDNNFNHRLSTVRSLARFFAQSWQHRSLPDPDTLCTISADCNSSFDFLATNLGHDFQVAINQIRGGLPALFSGKYPLVVTHGDLNEMNMLANSETGEITGIVDWAETSIQPFGFALYALDHIIGYLTPDGWVFHDYAEDLRNEFWSVFYSLVGRISESEMVSAQLARQVGLFLRYGIPHRPGRKGVVGVGGPGSLSIAILHALVLD